MTRPKFSPKVYTKDRVYVPVKGYSGISRLYVWDKGSGEYRPPAVGKCYLARRRKAKGMTKRPSRYFQSLAEARDWQHGLLEEENSAPTRSTGPTFGDVLESYKTTFSSLRPSTEILYEGRLQWFSDLKEVRLPDLSEEVISNWLGKRIKAHQDTLKAGKATTRTSFTQDVRFLGLILRWWTENKDTKFVSPIREHHYKTALLRSDEIPKPAKKVKLKEFYEFLDALQEGSGGALTRKFAVVQFLHAKRISEVAALTWEQVHLDFENPEESRIYWSEKIRYKTRAGEKPTAEAGLKNRKGSSAPLEQTMMPEAFDVLRELWTEGATGLVFRGKNGRPLVYATVYNRYNRAFAKSGFKYSGTHTMRHGGATNAYNETGGDLEIVKQLLGNSTLKSVMVYAERDQDAMNEYAKSKWRKPRLVASGRKRA